MKRARPAAAEATALQVFVLAVRVLSQDPRRANVERYLTASRELEELRAAPVRRQNAA